MQAFEFTCARCGFTFPKGRGDDEAWAEARANFGDKVDKVPTVMICDECFTMFMEARKRRP